MSGHVQTHIDSLESAKASADSAGAELAESVTQAASRVTGALDGVDAQIVGRIEDTVEEATRVLSTAIEATFEGLAEAINIEIGRAEAVLESS